MPLIGIAKMAAESPVLENKRRVTYLELPAKSFIGACSGKRQIFDWTVNPYRGCEYGCRYCYARYTHEFMELSADDFETRIFAKQWDAAQFRLELRRLAPGDTVAFGTATDCYQPAERRFGLMRRMLEEMHGAVEELVIGITTKSDLVARDVDLLGALARRNDVRVNVTITTHDPALARKLEPFAPSPALRLAAMAKLTAAGVSAGVGVSPVLPLITDTEASLEAVAQAAKAAGARTFWAQPLFLKDSARKVFLPWLEREFPALSTKYAAWYSREAYLKEPYVGWLKERVDRVRQRHGFDERGGHYRPPDWLGPAQMRLFG
ncbi:MAG: radical SAM protein [Bryobacterales bacterium]|nr:radical SAM protein [Bryobacterales bacterium]